MGVWTLMVTIGIPLAPLIVKGREEGMEVKR